VRPENWEDFFWSVVAGTYILTPVTLTLAWLLYLKTRKWGRGE
jgi:hypothetical protein